MSKFVNLFKNMPKVISSSLRGFQGFQGYELNHDYTYAVDPKELTHADLQSIKMCLKEKINHTENQAKEWFVYAKDYKNFLASRTENGSLKEEDIQRIRSVIDNAYKQAFAARKRAVELGKIQYKIKKVLT